jgi:soluble lytic murein transglycosylase-like protein
MRAIAILLCLAASAAAGEYVVFSNGYRIRVDRHEESGEKVVCYSGESRFEIAASQVGSYVPEDYTPPPVAEVITTPAPAQPEPTPAELADAAADRYGVPRWLVRGVIAAESNWDPRAVSPKGAQGLMQLMPGTAKELGADARDTASGIDAGVRHLRDLLVKYEGRLWHALAAYNAGQGAVDRYRGVPPYAETIEYITRISRQAPAEALVQKSQPAKGGASVAGRGSD